MSKRDHAVICYVGIGSNRGDPVARCLESIDRIAAVEGVDLLRRSSLYRTEPVGPVEQDWFVNGVAEIRTHGTPRTLLERLQLIEEEMGRQRAARWGPRTIDLDILLYGQEVVSEGDLAIPHRELHLRRFVLVPLNEIASYVIHPLFGISVRGLLDRLTDTSDVQLLDIGH